MRRIFAVFFLGSILVTTCPAIADDDPHDAIQRQILAAIQKLDADVVASQQHQIVFFPVGNNLGNQPDRLKSICKQLNGEFYSYATVAGDSIGGLSQAQLGCKF